MGVVLGAVEQEIEPLPCEEGQAPASNQGADSAKPGPSQPRLGGVRADFVATLGRRVAELRSLCKQLESDPSRGWAREDLRRRFSTLAANAKLLRFARVAEELLACEALLAMAAERAEQSSPEDLATIQRVLDGITSVAWGEAAIGELSPSPPRVAPPSSRPRPSTRLDDVHVPLVHASEPEPAQAGPLTVLVVGPVQLADALSGAEQSSGGFEVERALDESKACALARALAPDVIIIDAERAQARELVEALSADPLTELVPIIVVGRFNRPSDAASFVALGVARALPRPVSPDTLRRACADVTAAQVRKQASRGPLGSTTIDELVARLSEELRRGLGEAAITHENACVDLGEGSEVLAALWGAVARVRDIVTIQSKGEIRFTPSGPEGALPLASWLGDSCATAGERRGRQTRDPGRAGSRRLDQRTIVVADDDPAVTWFLAGVLRAAGAVVHEAHDGIRALELAFRFAPDLVISDVLMPRLDGFGLCRALRRDLVLCDVPVILLSWKEDLLQRVRELGVEADGYLRKEASASAIVERVREALSTRARVAERIAAAAAEGGEVRGRLDGLTTRTLLSFACMLRPSSLVSVRDAAYLYEIELRAGRPVRATRTSPDGAFERGATVLASLLGTSSGRFVIAPAPGRQAPPELEGSLDEQLMPAVAAARAGQRLLSGASLMNIERVEIAAERMTGYIAATPEPARSLFATLAAGASPRALITSGQAAPRLVEDVLCDAAAHGAITSVISQGGEELLEPAIERELDVLRGIRSLRPAAVTPVLDLGPVVATTTPPPVEVVSASDLPLPTVEEDDDDDEHEPIALVSRTPAPEPSSAPLDAEIDAEIDAEREPPAAAPEAIVAEDKSAVTPGKPLVTLGSLTPPPVMPIQKNSAIPKAPPPPVITVNEESPSQLVRRPSSFLSPELSSTAINDAAKNKDAAQDKPKDASSKEGRSMWLLFALAGVVFAVGARMSRDRLHLAPPPPPPAATTAAPPEPSAAPSAEVATTPLAEGESKDNPILPTEIAIRPEDKVPAGQGLLEVVAGTSDAIYIDHVLAGNGPIVKRALAPRDEPYEIRVKLRGEERTRFVKVNEGRLSRLKVAPPWSR